MQIEEEKDLLKELIDSFPFEVWLKDIKGRYKIINKCGENILGKPSSYIIGKTDYELYPGNYASKYVETDLAVINGELVGHYELEYNNGIYEEYKSVILDKSNRSIGVAGFSKDVTQLKKTQNALIESNRSKAVLISNLPGVAYRSMLDDDYSMVFVSEGCYELTGYTSEELLAHKPSYYDLIVPECRCTLLNKRIGGLGYKPNEYQIRTASGKIKWVWEQYQIVYDSNQQIYFAEGLIIDITDRKQAEKELKESEERFRTMFEEAPLGMGIFDSFTGKPYQVNKRFTEISGRSIEEIMSLSWEQYTCPDDILENQQKMNLLVSNKISGFALVKRFVKPCGKVIWVNVTVTPYKYKNANNAHLCMVEDITERKQAEELRIYRDSLEKTIQMKDEFLSLISHEFRTPLAVIISAIQMLKTFSWNELSDKAKGYFNTIRQNSNRQLKLVNNILDITKANSGSFEVHKTNTDIVQLTKLILESIGPYADRKKIRVSFSFEQAKIVIGIDEDKYERILLNLLSNAIKYTPKGESISVKLSKKLVKNKTMACVQVCDNGIGIPIDKQERIFERFGQVDSVLSRQAEGTGIGLYLTRMFIEMLGGEIRIDSELGVGSTFTVLLPVTKVKNTNSKTVGIERTDNRTIQLTDIEFSDVYLDKH